MAAVAAITGPAGEWGTALAGSAGAVAVGGPRAGSGGEARVLSAANGAQIAQLTGASMTAVYGGAIAVSADLLVVGVPGEAIGEGVVEIAAADGAGGWQAPEQVVAPEPGQLSMFGYAVALLGDRVVVGAPGLDPSGVRAGGGVYVLARKGDAWTVETLWAPSDLAVGEGFGTALSASGDTVAIGAPGRDGRVALATLADGPTWASGLSAQPGAHLGQSVFLNGDTVYAGAPDAVCDDGAPSCGAVVAGDGTVFIAPNPQRGDRFGAALAAEGDLLVVGAPGASDHAGAVHLFGLAASAGQARTVVGDAPRGRFGASVALLEDHLWIGAPYAAAPCCSFPDESRGPDAPPSVVPRRSRASQQRVRMVVWALHG